MLFSYVPFGVTVMVLGCPDYLQVPVITKVSKLVNITAFHEWWQKDSVMDYYTLLHVICQI